MWGRWGVFYCGGGSDASAFDLSWVGVVVRKYVCSRHHSACTLVTTHWHFVKSKRKKGVCLEQNDSDPHFAGKCRNGHQNVKTMTRLVAYEIWFGLKQFLPKPISHSEKNKQDFLFGRSWNEWRHQSDSGAEMVNNSLKHCELFRRHFPS